jgi:ABC-type oligopeptide transport system substrate-binding subunit
MPRVEIRSPLMNEVHKARRGKRVILSLLAATCLVFGSPAGAAVAANSSGAQKPVSASHGDCKNDNNGKHQGYVCPTAPVGGETGNTGTGGDVGGVFVF